MRRVLLFALCVVATGCANGPAASEQPKNLDIQVAEAFRSPDVDKAAAAAMYSAADRTARLAQMLVAIDRALDVASDNLINAETISFKSKRAVNDASGVARLETDFSQGSIDSTNRNFDLAISGDGFFTVKADTESGTAYSRNGNFFVNKDGLLILGIGDGQVLLPPITIPKGTTDVIVSQEGEVSVLQAGSATKKQVGQIKLAMFTDPTSLKAIGSALYKNTDQSGEPIPGNPGQNGAGKLLQGSLERSNVSPINERLQMKFLNKWRAEIIRAIDDSK